MTAAIRLELDLPPSQYRDEHVATLQAVADAAATLRAEAARPGGPRGRGDRAEVDVELCEYLVEALGERFPTDEIHSEEFEPRRGTSGRAFWIDPHDGTRDFLRGSRETSISVALVDHGRLVMGVVWAPLLELEGDPGGLRVDWSEGQPVRERGRPIEPRTREQDGDGRRVLVATRIDAAVRSKLDPFELVPCASMATRLALVAVGRAAACLCVHPMAAWDFAAGQALVEAMGGALVDADRSPIQWDGTALRTTGKKARAYFAARTPELAAALARRASL